MRLSKCLLLAGLSIALVGCDGVFGLQEMRDVRPKPCGWDLQVGPDSTQVMTSVANGGNERVVFAGQFAERLDFGRSGPAEEGNGVFVGGYDGATDTLWKQSIVGDAPVVAALTNGIVVLAGNSGHGVNCGDGDVLPNGGLQPAYLCAFSPEGKPSWGRVCSSTGELQTVHGISAAGPHHFIIVGGYDGTIHCGEDGGGMSEPFNSTDIFVYKLHESGLVEWAKSFGGMGYQLARAVAVNGADDVLLAGQYMDSFAFPDGGTLLEYHVDNFAADQDIFVVKLSGTDGKHLWSRRFGVGGDDRVTGIAANPEGDVYVAGTTQGTIGSHTADASVDYFLLKLNGTDGSEQWTRGFRSPGGTSPHMSVTANLAGDVIVSGTFGGTMTSREDFTLTAKSDRDTFIAVFSKGDEPLWHKQWPTKSGFEARSALTAHPSGSITWGGAFAEAVDFGCEERTPQGIDAMLVNILP